MKRREFISRLAVTPLAVGSLWAVPTLPEARVFGRSLKSRTPLKLGPIEARLVDFLRPRSGSCYLNGAPVMSYLSGSAPQWINVVASFDSFADLKRELFEFGVSPVSTPDLPASMIKFRYGERIFNVVDGEIESFCQSAYFSAKERMLAFTHSFLVWDTDSTELYDPYEAFEAGKPRPFRLAGRPASLTDAFDWVLAGHFEGHFLNLPLSEDFRGLEAETFETEAPAISNRNIIERVVNYLPEVVDTLGIDLARTIAGSPLVCGAMRRELKIDFAETFAQFEALRQPRPRFKSSGVEFMTALHQSLGESGDLGLLPGAAHRTNRLLVPGVPFSTDLGLLPGELCRFMVQNQFTFRRPEWLNSSSAELNFEVTAPPSSLG